LNVVHVITTIERGGAETQLLTLVNEQIRQGKRVRILYLKGAPALEGDLVAAGAEVISVLANRNPIFQLTHLKRVIGPDCHIVHCHLPRAELLAALVKVRPFLVSRHNAEKFFPSAPSLVSRLLSKFVLARGFACIAISAAVRDFLYKENEVPRGKEVRLVHYGIDKSKFNSIDRQPFIESQIKIGTISRLVPQKNLELLLAGFNQLCYSQPGATLQIVGKGILEKELKEFAAELNIESKLAWVNQISDVPGFFQKIDIFCLTSNYEGFGLVLLESMAAGVPIISKANDATVEVLGKDYPYLLWENNPGDLSKAISKLANDSEINKIRLRNFERLEKFTATRMEREISDIYNSF
jgi:glycosyltransferase involved in cell wall biosynthesis